ncbi:hypothetical protein ACWE6V_004842, partial [Escherichia coli]
LVPTTYLVDTTLSNSSDSDQTVQAVRLPMSIDTEKIKVRFIQSDVGYFFVQTWYPSHFCG